MVAKKRTAAEQSRRQKSEFTRIGDEAKAEAQKKVLLKSLKAHGWNMTACAEALGMGHGTGVLRALKQLAPEEYAAAKADGRISPGNHRADE